MPSLKTCIRRFLAWSSVSFVARLYRLGYSLLIALAVRVFRRTGAAEAVYLTRGCSKQEILPGVSDIDFVVVAAGGPLDREKLDRSFRTLQSISAGLIPANPYFVVTPEELRYRWDSVPNGRYRLQEGKTNWRLLHGRDVLGTLPELNEIERKEACAAEMDYWWVHFARFVLHGGPYANDFVIRNSICYKAAAEVMNARWTLRTGQYCYSKPEALRRENSEFAARLQKKVSHRFLGRDRELEEATYRFLVATFCETWDLFAGNPFIEVYPGVRQTVDLAGDDPNLETVQSVGRELEGHAAAHWKSRCQGVRVLKSAFWAVEDHLLVLEVAPAALPSLDALDALLRLVEGRRQIGRGRLFLFLKAGRVVFPLTPDMPRDLYRGVLTAATAPDVFLQLGDEPVFWTSHSKWYLTDWQRNRQWLDLSPLKRKQLETIARGAAGNHIVYPLTETAIGKPD